MTETKDIDALAKGGRTNIAGFVLRLAARIPFLFIAGRLYGPDLVGRFALAVVVVELAALVATLGLKRGLAQALSSSDQPHAHVVWDALALAFVLSVAASAVLIAFPEVMYANTQVTGLDRFLPCIIVAVAWSDVSLAALAYRHDVKAAVTARAVVEPWTISIAAWVFSFVTIKDGLVLSYVASMIAALIASFVPFLKSYGVPHGWSPHLGQLFRLARANAPLAGADALEWGTRNVDRFILGVMFEPKVVGIYYMAQQVASTGAVCESALVYTARHRNLVISIAMLGVQIALSFALIVGMRALGWPETWQAAGPAVALMIGVGLTSVIKARLLGRILAAPVSPWRWSLGAAAVAAIAVGGAFTSLPHRFEWLELIGGEPAIAATYLFVLWRWAFGPADRALFGKMPQADEATLPNVGSPVR